jgi:hypothetical protein
MAREEHTIPSYIHVSPSIISISSQTGSGKSSLLYGILRYVDKVFDIPPVGVVLCYATHQELYKKIQRRCPVPLTLHCGLPTQEHISEYRKKFGGEHWVLALDDLSTAMVDSKDMLNVFLVNSHHQHYSVIFLRQNFFTKGRYSRDMNLQVKYAYLPATRTDKHQIASLGSRMYPGHTASFMRIYDDATENVEQYPIDGIRQPSYLLVNMNPYEKNKLLQLTTSRLPPEGGFVAYLI